jgi:hypothetical protein
MNLHLPARPVHWVEAIMIQKTSYYDRQSQHICAIAIDGNNAAEIIDGDLIFRKFYKDAAKTQIDIQKTSDYFLDTVFYETNRVLRTPSKEPYSENRDLKLVPLADIVAKSGKEFQIVYNANRCRRIRLPEPGRSPDDPQRDRSGASLRKSAEIPCFRRNPQLHWPGGYGNILNAHSCASLFR